MPHSRCLLSEPTSTFLELYSGFVNLLSPRDCQLLIGFLEGKFEVSFVRSDFGFWYDYFESDGMFVLFSLLVGVNNEFFTNNISECVLSVKVEEMSPPAQTRQVLQQQFHKIRNRWTLLDKISVSIYSQSAGLDVCISRLMNVVIVKLRERLFERLLEVGRNFTQSNARNASSTEGLDPFDASFCLPLIDKDNFAAVSKLVDDNLIALFIPARFGLNCRGYYLRYYMAESDTGAIEVNDVSEGTTPCGVLWKNTIRKSEVRKFVEFRLLLNVMNVLCFNGEDAGAETQLTLDERSCSFFSFLKKLSLSQALWVIWVWQLPPDLLLTSYEALARSLFEKTTACEVLNKMKACRVTHFCTVYERTIGWLTWMTERVLMEFGVQVTEASFFDKTVRILATLDCSETISTIIEEVGDSFSIQRIKEYARFFVSSSGVSASALKTLLVKFPWLLNTWIDHSGNTLLCLCVMHDYPHFRRLLGMPLVKKHINVESKDGLTPLMLAADYPSKVRVTMELLHIGSADAYHINSNRESMLHRMAASNNSIGLTAIGYLINDFTNHCPIVELRRNEDSATALMIALSRENVDAAEVLMSCAGAKATTLFGHSRSLRTVDAMFLRGKSLSLALLSDFGLEPDAQVIADSINDGLLFTEEYSVAMTGMENNSRVSNEVYRGNVSVRLEKRILGAARKGVCVITEKKVTGVHHISELLKDVGWTLLNDRQDFSNAEWVTHLLNNKREEVDATKSYETNECAICIGEFKPTDCASSSVIRGKTKCGHYFHARCWAGLWGTNRCPLCRTATTFAVERSSPFDPDPQVMLRREPDGQRSYKVIERGVTSASSMSSKEREVEGEEEEQDSYCNVGRYEFLIDGVWVDESSRLNVLEEGKSSIIALSQ